jgi:antitoxin (DNA-binding transcriptional repressor) of toxin-antitoxin stability system
MPETTIELSEVSAKVPDMLDRLRKGEEFSITQEGKVIALLVPAEDPERRRALGMCRGKIWISPDFNEPLSEEELKEWGY